MVAGGSTRVTSIDGLRAVAVGLVVAYHLTGVMPGGWVGVNVFFVISGWIITSLLVREAQQRGSIDLLAFYTRRFLRLTPPLLVTVALVVVLEAAFVPVRVGFGWDVVAALTYWTDFRLMVTTHASALNHTWSLAVEEQFYLVWPLVLVVGLRRPGRLVPTVAIALAVSVPVMVVAASTTDVVAVAPWGHAPSLLVGALAAVLGHRVRVGLVGAVASLAVLLGWALVVDDGRSWVYQGPVLLVAVCTAALVLHLSSSRSWLTSVFSWAPAAWIGERSYGIYLYHFPILFLVPEVPLPAHSSALVVVVASVAMAGLSFMFIEEPVRRLGRRWTVERTTRFELATSTLGRSRSTN